VTINKKTHLQIAASVTEHGTNIDATGVHTPVDLSGTFSGTCTKGATLDAGIH